MTLTLTFLSFRKKINYMKHLLFLEHVTVKSLPGFKVACVVGRVCHDGWTVFYNDSLSISSITFSSS